MTESQDLDSVDRIIEQWTKEKPELELSAMATIGRLKKCTALIQQKLDETFAEFSLTSWEFDVLATLQRSGSPYALAPTVLFSSLMITSGTMTHRMNRLESRSLVERVSNPADARSKLLQLTDSGLDLINRAVEAHVKNEERLLSSLAESDLRSLDLSLKALLGKLEEK